MSITENFTQSLYAKSSAVMSIPSSEVISVEIYFDYNSREYVLKVRFLY